MPLHMFPFFFLRTVIGACDTEGPEQGPEGALPDDKYDLILLSHHSGDAATVARNRERRVPRQNQGSMFTRRRLLKGSAQAAAVAAATALMPPNVQKLLAAGVKRAPALHDIKHVVLLMQENRSFDHYFGMLPGVRGFGDRDALTLSTGRSVFHQPEIGRAHV